MNKTIIILASVIFLSACGDSPEVKACKKALALSGMQDQMKDMCDLYK